MVSATGQREQGEGTTTPTHMTDKLVRPVQCLATTSNAASVTLPQKLRAW